MTLSLLARTPPLLNLPGFDFNENMPLRNLPPLVDTVPGASAIQAQIEWSEWATQAGQSGRVRRRTCARGPLAGVPAKSMILQYARGDQTVPNPTTSAIIRAGALQDRTTVFRNDLALGRRSDLPEEPAHVPDPDPRPRTRRRGGCSRARGAGADRAVLRLGRHDA